MLEPRLDLNGSDLVKQCLFSEEGVWGLTAAAGQWRCRGVPGVGGGLTIIADLVWLVLMCSSECDGWGIGRRLQRWVV